MRWNAFSSFRSQLTLWLVGLSLGSVLGVGFYIGEIATDGLVASGGELLHTRAQSAADLLATNLRERELEIELLSQAPQFTQTELGGAAIRKALELRKAAHDEYAWMGVADAGGRVLQATGGLLLGQQVDQRPWFLAGKQGVFTGDVHEAVMLAKLLPQKSPDQPLRFIDFAAPIRDEAGQLRGVLAAHASWNWVTDTVASVVTSQATQSQTEVLIADSKGTILYPFQFTGQLHLPNRKQAGSHYEVLNWGSSGDYLTCVVDVKSTTKSHLGWRIVMRQPVKIALAPAVKVRNHLLVIGLVLGVLLAALAYRFSARFSRPIEQLAHAVQAVERQDGIPQYPMDSHSREIDQLSRSVQSMTESLLEREHELAELNASLETQVVQRTAALAEVNQELERLATHDALTGLYNRRCFDSTLHAFFLTFQRTERPFSLLVVDADHFKQINDTHGHAVGDEVLQLLADVLQECTRSTDFVARYGGEEFVLLLPDAVDNTQGLVVAEKIRHTVETSLFPRVGPVTVSVGLSCSAMTDTTSSQVFSRADTALYQAKEQGRNRVVSWSGDVSGRPA
jgi:diguanylate cyclase (GGDEF)-like protein